MQIYFERICGSDYDIAPELSTNSSSLIYGEVSHNDIYKIINEIKSNESNFLDIGSGCGKLAIYLAKKLNVFVDGIEIDKNRYEKSNQLIDKFDLFDKVSFINNDFRNLYFGNYDFLYCCNLVFDQEDNNILYLKIEKEFNGIFILFEYSNKLSQYFIKQEQVQTSWSKRVNIFIFKK
ncbi:hypothetical protein CPAV1605_1553 [seawater metagenome]|uniref:Methyltransferase domain-containing protein n=1 Tax=seawater metagenome TaxID=1561972 RepID=A0A5E8CKY2_9ZZZZ